MEREVLLTGIGGQGVQLAARTLAVAAIADGREVMVFGSYGGSMRGGNTDATVVVADRRSLTPPTVVRAWSALAMHHAYWPASRDRIDPAAWWSSTPACSGATSASTARRAGRRGVDVAADLGNARAASMVALGALVAATGLVSRGALVAAAAAGAPAVPGSARPGQRARSRRRLRPGRAAGRPRPGPPPRSRGPVSRPTPRPDRADPGHGGDRRRGLQGLRAVHRRLPARACWR